MAIPLGERKLSYQKPPEVPDDHVSVRWGGLADILEWSPEAIVLPILHNALSRIDFYAVAAAVQWHLGLGDPKRWREFFAA